MCIPRRRCNQAYPWPVGECDACCATSVATVALNAPRVPLPPDGLASLNAPFAVASTTASSASPSHLSQHDSSQASERASFHRVNVVGDATSVEAARNPHFGPVSSKSSNAGHSIPPLQSSSRRAAWARLLKRSLRRAHLATGCAPEVPWVSPPLTHRGHCIKSHSDEGKSKSNRSSSSSRAALEVLDTVPRSGWVQSPPLVRGDPVSWMLRVVRVTQTTMVTLSTTSSSFSAAIGSHIGNGGNSSTGTSVSSSSDSTAPVEELPRSRDSSSSSSSSSDAARLTSARSSVVERLWYALASSSTAAIGGGNGLSSSSSHHQGDGLPPPLTQRQGSPLAALEALQSALLLPLWLRATAMASPENFQNELDSSCRIRSSHRSSGDRSDKSCRNVSLPRAGTTAMAAASAASKAGHEPDLSLLPRGLLLSGPPGVGKTFAVQRAVDAVNLVLQVFRKELPFFLLVVPYACFFLSTSNEPS